MAQRIRISFKMEQASAAVAQWIRRLPTEQEIHGSSPCSGILLDLPCFFNLHDHFLFLFVIGNIIFYH